MANLFITGGLGHIGSRLIHGLKKKDFDSVYIMDNLLTQRYPSLFNLSKKVKFYFIENDICTASLDRYFKKSDYVIHLAAITDAASSVDRIEDVERVNFHGTERIARACIRHKCRLLFPSTTSVYGVQKELVDETCPITDLKPQSPYAESKLRAEQLLKHLGEKEGLKFVICRFGTIFGTSIGMRFHTAVNKFCWQAVMGQPLTVWETAYEQKRPYLDIEDAERAIKFILSRDLFDGAVYNVVTRNFTVKDIVAAIRREVPLLKVGFVKNKIMNQLSYEVNNKKFRSLGFSFSGCLDRCIRQTIRQFCGIVNAKEMHE